MGNNSTKNNYYVVVKGREPGIYQSWDGDQGASAQVKGFSGAVYRGFKNLLEARWWLEDNGHDELLQKLKNHRQTSQTESRPPDDRTASLLESGKVVIHTDGGAINNPGPGGYGAVLRYGDKSREIFGGFRRTTNNRMELLACIKALAFLQRECNVILHSDSRYVVNGIEKGWAMRWRSNEWKRNKREMASNVDLWAPLLELYEQHDATFQWVKGHAGNQDNERCDQLATRAAKSDDLVVDRAYENDRTTRPDASDHIVRGR